jgi:tetratricopeptide (TPR) repeat protein
MDFALRPLRPFVLPLALPVAALIVLRGHGATAPASGAWEPALAAAVAAEEGGAAIDEELAYARGLASEWQFIDLAEAVLARVGSRELAGEDREQLEFTRCQVYGDGARFAADPRRREELFLQALDAYRSFVDAFPRSTWLEAAKRAYVDVGAAYINSMELSLESAAGAEAERIREALRGRLEELILYSGEQISSLRAVVDLPPAEKQELAKLLLYRAQMSLSFGRISEDPGYWYQLAEQAVEELTSEFGDTSGWGLSGYLVLGEVYLEQELGDDAASFFEFVIDSTIPTDLAAWNEWVQATQPTRERLDGLWYFVELATPRWIEAAEQAGDQQTAIAAALHFHNTWRREGLTLSPRGHLALMATARALLDSSGFLGGEQDALAWFETYEAAREAGFVDRRIRSAAELALELGSYSNEQNKGNTLQIRAQQLIADAIDRPGVEVSVDTRFEAAKGYYNARNYPVALREFRALFAELGDDTSRKLHSPRLLYHIGRSFQLQERHLEAALAYREGVIRWAGDAEYDELNANGFYNAMRRLRRDLKDDPSIVTLADESEQVMRGLGADPGTIAYRQATRDFDGGEYEAARASFLAVERAAPVYEKAVVKAARSLYHLGQLDEALREFDAYLGDYLNDPKNRLSSTDQAGRQARDEATAEATYYKGQVAWDQGRFAEVIELYRDFPGRFGNQPDLVAAALYFCVRAALEIGDLEQAQAFETQLLENFPQTEFTGGGATLLFNFVTERHGEAEQAGDRNGARAMLALMARYAEVSNSLRAEPDFRALLQEARLWRDLQEWAKAEEDFRELLRRFGGSEEPEIARTIERSATPDLADALLALRRIPEAFELVAPLVPDPNAENTLAAAPPQQTVEAFCRAVAGWVEGDPNDPTIVAGVGGAENFEKAGPWWRKISTRFEKWTDCNWYEAEFQRIWTYYQYSKEDSAKLSYAKDVLNTIRAEVGTGFELIQENCNGDTRLRDRFRWLARQL